LLLRRSMRGYLALPILAACGTSGDDGPASSIATGTYRVESQLDVTVDTVLPEPAADFVATLHDFSLHPAHTLVDLADNAGVPALAELRAVLPDALESELEGWLDAEIVKVQIDGVPLTKLAGDLALASQDALTHFTLASTLDVDGARATHRLTAIDFAPAGFDARFDLTAAPGDIITATADISTSRAGIAIGDHSFGLAYGPYVWRAIERQVTKRFGADLRTTIGTAVNCPRVAAAVAGDCVLGVCVGHQTELTEICEAGLDQLVGVARDKISELRLDVLRLAKGSAQLIDADDDGIAEALADGTWNAEIDAGLGPHELPATFAATR